MMRVTIVNTLYYFDLSTILIKYLSFTYNFVRYLFNEIKLKSNSFSNFSI